MFTRQQVNNADLACKLYGIFKRPSQERFEAILASNAIANCTITAKEAKKACTIYGPDLYALKASSIKSKPSLIPSFIPMTLPSYVLDEHKDITLCADFFMYRVKSSYIHCLARSNSTA